MSLPKPETGLVIRYSYLWDSEARRGQEEGVKDRPCAVVLASQQQPDGQIRVTVAPITHTQPEKGTGAIEVPPKVGQHLGFDAAKSWIITSEINRFTWPGPDIRAANSKNFAFGHLPSKLALAVRDGVLERNREQLKTVERDEPVSVKDWKQSPSLTQPPAAPPRKDWGAVSQDKPREIKPLPPRDPSRDRDR